MPKANAIPPAQAELPELPAELAGWRWHATRARGSTTGALEPHYALQEPDSDWMTAAYTKPERTIAEAKRRVLSQPKPKPKPAAPTDEEIADARARLVAVGYDVRPQGIHWRVQFEGGDATVLKSAELIDLAAPFPPAAPEQPPGSSSSPLPLMDLISALDDHAARLPKPLPTDHRIPLPMGLPDRLAAPLDLVQPGRYQPRTKFDQDELDQLAASIQEHGILTALKVFANERGHLELIAGERRLRAARQAGLAFVPVELCSYSLRQIDEISTIDNLQRKDLSPIEEGTAYERMIRDWGISEAELGRRLGKNRGYIQQRRAIASAVPEVVAALDTGDITFSQARAIAQAAPGQTKAQKTALGKLAELTKQGRRTTEADARAAAEKAVLALAKKDLTALGWTINEPHGHFVIWAPAERPRQWTGAEMLEAIRTQQRPSGEVPAELTGAKKGDTLLPTLKIRYRLDDDYAPWVGLAEDWNQEPTFYAAAELGAVAEQIMADYAAMQARAQAHGWTLEADSSGSYSQARFTFQFTATGAQQSTWGWPEAEKILGYIETGKVKTEPQRVPQSATYPCGRCGTVTSDYRWVEDAKYCQTCAPLIQQAIVARKQGIAAEVAAVLTPWLDQAPLEALRLLIAARPGRQTYNNGREESARQIRAAAAPDLARAILTWIATIACEDHASPVYGEGATAAAVADVAAAADEVDTILALSSRLSAVESWIAQALHDAASLAEISLQRTALEAIGDDLQELVDDDDVTDDIYEDLLMRIGAATEQLLQLAEVGDAPQLAEVGV